jgi:type IV secretion system protein VirB11
MTAGQGSDAALGFLRSSLASWLDLAEDETALTEVLYDGEGRMALDVGGELVDPPLVALTDQDVLTFGNNAAVYADAVWSRERPFLSVIIPPDWRCSFMRPPASEHPVMALRKLRRQPIPLERWRAQGAFVLADEPEHEDPGPPRDDRLARLQWLVATRKTICISGEVGSGKTTLLRTLLGLIPSNERIVSLEDPRELLLTEPGGEATRKNYVALEASPAMELDALLRASLRLRPDRIIVGEVRGPEALELVRSLNVGHSGALFTLHSHGARDALDRLHSLVTEAQPGFHWESVERAIDAVVQIVGRGGNRRLAPIWETGDDDGR